MPEYRHDLAVAHNNRGNVLGELARYPEARRKHEKARDRFLELATNFPLVPGYRLELANTRNSLGRVLLGLQDFRRARREPVPRAELLQALAHRHRGAHRST